MQDPWLLIFVGGLGHSPVERLVTETHHAIALDLIDRSLQLGALERLLVVTDSPELAKRLPERVMAEVDYPPKADFHFGRRLLEVIDKYHIQHPFYIGGGSSPLLSAPELANIARELAKADNLLITNNLLSSDLVAFTPGEALHKIDPPPNDNALAQLLHHQAGLSAVSLPRTTATQFDIDTPTDLLILSLHPEAGPHVRDYLMGLRLDTARLRAALEYIVNPKAQIVVVGRVGSYVWSRLEQDTACRVRMLSEERGMRADGREERGEVRSLVGFYIEEVGIKLFFQTLAQLGDAAFIDTRVIFNHLHLRESPADRFLSDLGRPEEIEHPWVKEFTIGALEAPIPVILGGHSLVAGGMLALMDIAWLENDRRLAAGGLSPQ